MSAISTKSLITSSESPNKQNSSTTIIETTLESSEKSPLGTLKTTKYNSNEQNSSTIILKTTSENIDKLTSKFESTSLDTQTFEASNTSNTPFGYSKFEATSIDISTSEKFLVSRSQPTTIDLSKTALETATIEAITRTQPTTIDFSETSFEATTKEAVSSVTTNFETTTFKASTIKYVTSDHINKTENMNLSKRSSSKAVEESTIKYTEENPTSDRKTNLSSTNEQSTKSSFPVESPLLLEEKSMDFENGFWLIISTATISICLLICCSVFVCRWKERKYKRFTGAASPPIRPNSSLNNKILHQINYETGKNNRLLSSHSILVGDSKLTEVEIDQPISRASNRSNSSSSMFLPPIRPSSTASVIDKIRGMRSSSAISVISPTQTSRSSSRVTSEAPVPFFQHRPPSVGSLTSSRASPYGRDIDWLWDSYGNWSSYANNQAFWKTRFSEPLAPLAPTDHSYSSVDWIIRDIMDSYPTMDRVKAEQDLRKEKFELTTALLDLRITNIKEDDLNIYEEKLEWINALKNKFVRSINKYLEKFCHDISDDDRKLFMDEAQAIEIKVEAHSNEVRKQITNLKSLRQMFDKGKGEEDTQETILEMCKNIDTNKVCDMKTENNEERSHNIENMDQQKPEQPNGKKLELETSDFILKNKTANSTKNEKQKKGKKKRTKPKTKNDENNKSKSTFSYSIKKAVTETLTFVKE